jgi:hypothetical protein
MTDEEHLIFGHSAASSEEFRDGAAAEAGTIAGDRGGAAHTPGLSETSGLEVGEQNGA